MPFTSAYRPTPFVLPPHAPCASRLACAGARVGAAMIAATASDAVILLEAMMLPKPERIDVSPLVGWARPLARESARPEVPLYACDERGRAGDVEQYVLLDVRQIPQMRRECDPDHFRVWTSTDSTAGRSRTMGVQLSPLSADTYTCPPVVPKYTPHLSSESMAIASRSTFT